MAITPRNNQRLDSNFKPKARGIHPRPIVRLLNHLFRPLKRFKTHTSAPDFRDNLNKTERQAIHELRKRDDIVIKPADKGSAIVAMGKQFYREEANRLLGNPQHYKLLDSDPTQEITQNVKRVIQKIVSNGSIDRKLGQNLLENDPKPGRFYFLPKIHKEGNPGRPIISVMHSD
ncbi:hypothetical protein BSL78_24444 [Apostichopus japonicus]|uniref:Uncharacterized protein n=1 Tax=Stichopus japonicus TaxID=307972 RepID=A0A2G8JSH3_STIJA|nr:hypothetical protein BSL78_24444 [Apostichopus japonicus]